MVAFVTAGGTGGHIFPGIALFEELKACGHSPFFIGGERDKRFDAVLRLGAHHIRIPSAPLYRRKMYRNFKSLFLFVKGFFRALSLIKALKPDVCIGMGGYVTAPVLLACRFRGVPYIICEQNAYPGFANRRFAAKAAKVILNFSDAQQFLAKKAHAHCLTLGNPVRPGFVAADTQSARRFFGIKPSQLVVGVMGGSQGAASINEAMLPIVKKYKKVLFLWSTGQKNYQATKAKLRGSNVQLHAFVERMDLFLSACDLVVSRAGATSLSEIAATGTASLLVPYPYATADHQTKNGAGFSKNGAAVVVPEGEGFTQRFSMELEKLLEKPALLSGMGKKAAKLYKEDIAAKMCEAAEAVAASGGGNG